MAITITKTMVSKDKMPTGDSNNSLISSIVCVSLKLVLIIGLEAIIGENGYQALMQVKLLKIDAGNLFGCGAGNRRGGQGGFGYNRVFCIDSLCRP
ncbi:hypothetical protein [Neisseria sp.]|uniref:hypothetical protein n=1 Tax=Neisseria sp. TaxID=192066 RepID=UPI0026DDC036|nr:hypothetical protein [Neisseria sp.]MDO4226600.1 hypothetical protein [Neisseria sp.]